MIKKFDNPNLWKGNVIFFMGQKNHQNSKSQECAMLRCYLLCRTSQSNSTGSKIDGWSNMLKVNRKIVGVKGH